jgi:hypothetical protein
MPVSDLLPVADVTKSYLLQVVDISMLDSGRFEDRLAVARDLDRTGAIAGLFSRAELPLRSAVQLRRTPRRNNACR